MSAHTSQTELKLIGKLILEGDLHCETGLHVGAGKGSLEIGGSDNPVVKDAFGRPYVPGSSLCGKIRSLLQTRGRLSPFSVSEKLGVPHPDPYSVFSILQLARKGLSVAILGKCTLSSTSYILVFGSGRDEWSPDDIRGLEFESEH